MMALRLPHSCRYIVEAVGDSRVPLTYEPRFREYVLILQGGSAVQVISFCPWDGVELPSPLREEFFDTIHELGFEIESDDLPIEFTSDAWWRNRDLE